MSKQLPGPDHRFSSDPKDFCELIQRVRELELNLGSVQIGPTVSEVENRIRFRLSCVAARDLPAGHLIEQGDIAFRRPGSGMAPKYAEFFAGHQTKMSISSGEILRIEQFEQK